MTTLELQLDEDLNSFVQRQSRARGHASAAAYVESLLAVERLRERPEHVAAMLQEALDDPNEPQVVDDNYWKRLEAEVFGTEQADNVP
jgi:hypothetical protein